VEALPRHAASGALALADLDFHSGTRKLPLVKLIDDFSVGWGVFGVVERKLGEQPFTSRVF